MELYEYTVHELKEKLDNKEITYDEIIKSYLDRIDKVNPKINAYVSVLNNTENKGIPIAIKDNINIKGIKTTCSSKMLENFESPYNATVIDKLNEHGLMYIGKTNMDEFAMGGSTEHSAFFPTHNPWNFDRVPGGSSGGSAAAVAANLAPWALGSDTGGSIRQPSSFCGVVGLKPTYGLVSRYGLVAFASSLDQIGPITKDVTDSAILLNMIAGHDPKDSTSVNREKEDYTSYLINDVKGMKIGIPKEYIGDGVNDEVKNAILDVKDKYEKLGATVEECSFDAGKYAIAVYYIIACAEASSNLGRFDGIRYGYRSEKFESLDDIYYNSRSEGFGEEVKRRIILGTYVLSSGYYDAYYKKAQKVRTIIKNVYNELFNKYDLLLTPTSPTTAFKMGEKLNNPLEMYLSDICTVPINIAGLPAMSVPCALDKEGLPIGFQLIGKQFDEKSIFRAAYTYEQNANFRANKPNI